jgi:hypothetical protein
MKLSNKNRIILLPECICLIPRWRSSTIIDIAFISIVAYINNRSEHTRKHSFHSKSDVFKHIQVNTKRIRVSPFIYSI